MELYDPPIALTAQDDVGSPHPANGDPDDMRPIERKASRRNW
jgi:hypothetical protein